MPAIASLNRLSGCPKTVWSVKMSVPLLLKLHTYVATSAVCNIKALACCLQVALHPNLQTIPISPYLRPFEQCQIKS